MLLDFGRFGRPHGVRGEVRFWPYNPASPLLVEGRRIRIGREAGTSHEVVIESLRLDPKGPVIKLAAIDDRDAAARLNQLHWFEPRDAFPPAADDEVYVADLIGLMARTADGERIGEVVDVIDTGATELLVIQAGRRQHLVPNVAAFVQRMDLEGREIIITPIEGLLDGDG